MYDSAASRQHGLITVAIKTGKNFSLTLSLTGSSCHHTSRTTKDPGNFPLMRALRTTFVAFTLAHNPARPLDSLSSFISSHKRAQIRAICRLYCVNTYSASRHFVEWVKTLFQSLNDKVKKKKKVWLCEVSAPFWWRDSVQHFGLRDPSSPKLCIPYSWIGVKLRTPALNQVMIGVSSGYCLTLIRWISCH